jgi:hypothetical protein
MVEGQRSSPDLQGLKKWLEILLLNRWIYLTVSIRSFKNSSVVKIVSADKTAFFLRFIRQDEDV